MNQIIVELTELTNTTIKTIDAFRANIYSSLKIITELVMRGESEIPTRGYCGAQEAARYMNMPLGTLRQMVSKGKIKFYKPTGGKVYFRYSDLDAFMEGKQEEQKPNEMRGLI